ncbi:MAG: hypothetical protein Q9201_003412 [Fulgogasparrea decipioides]
MLLYLVAVDVLVIRRMYLNGTGQERSAVQDSHQVSAKEVNWGEDRCSQPDVPMWTSLTWAAHVFFSYRAIGTRREVKNVPSFAGRRVPSRVKFLVNRGLAIMGAFAFVDYLNHQPPASKELFAAHKSGILLSKREMTVETILVRIGSSAMFWLALRITIGLIYNMASFVGVATFLIAPADWLPYFGSATEIYSLRKYWAVFWHSAFRNPLVGTANFLAHDVLRLCRGTLAARYAIIWLVFGLSGIIHKLCDETAGIPPAENTAHRLFLMQALGITIEDSAQCLIRQTCRLLEHGRQSRPKDGKKQGKSRLRDAGRWQRVIGYIWVAAWLVLSTPAWSYQNMRHNGGQLFPLSLVEALPSDSG